jgi:hypothetical protein
MAGNGSVAARAAAATECDQQAAQHPKSESAARNAADTGMSERGRNVYFCNYDKIPIQGPTIQRTG